MLLNISDALRQACIVAQCPPDLPIVAAVAVPFGLRHYADVIIAPIRRQPG
jgi:hypothetical protein